MPAQKNEVRVRITPGADMKIAATGEWKAQSVKSRWRAASGPRDPERHGDRDDRRRETEAGIGSEIRPTGAQRSARLRSVSWIAEIDRERQQHPRHDPELDRVDRGPGNPVHAVSDQDGGVVEVEREARQVCVDTE